jgi:beta-galactosidase
MPAPDAPLYLGAAYYPEHWPEERWPEDIRLMREAGFNVARMAEFAWSALEPAEGDFRFDWLDRAVHLLGEAGIVSVLGTPTAAPPAWLIQAHPDILPVDEQGRRVQFGNRTHYCVNSPEYHAAVTRIVTAMGEHFGANPNVIGWQVDNEYSRVCYCDRCRSLFQQFLAEKFGTLDELNERWGTRYWSQTYSDWTQIPIPIGPHNPGLMLAFREFVTESYRKYQQLQLDALRPSLREEVWVTHNFMGWYDGFDHYRMAEDLDLASWDWYIATGHPDRLRTGAIHDLTRGFKQRNFWVIEAQPGSVNWSSVNNALDAGEGRVMAWHAIAHGADAFLYWQWRPALGGQEQYHGSLLDASGQPRPFYAEARWIGRDLRKAGRLIAGSTFTARVAILNDYASRWSIQWQPHHRDFDYVAHLTHYYRPLAARNIPVDILPADAPLEGYRLVIVPALIILDQARADRLKAFAKRGGHLILTLRTGMKDPYNALLPSRQPGPLAEMTGVEVEEFYALLDPVPLVGNLFNGQSRLWAERLKPSSSSMAIAIRYGDANGWLDNQPAITVHAHGSGMVWYVGAYLDDTAQQALLDHIIKLNSLRPPMEVPASVEVSKRVRADGQEVYILINHALSQEVVSLPWEAYDHLSQAAVSGEMPLGPYGVAVLTRAAT